MPARRIARHDRRGEPVHVPRDKETETECNRQSGAVIPGLRARLSPPARLPAFLCPYCSLTAVPCCTQRTRTPVAQEAAANAKCRWQALEEAQKYQYLPLDVALEPTGQSVQPAGDLGPTSSLGGRDAGKSGGTESSLSPGICCSASASVGFSPGVTVAAGHGAGSMEEAVGDLRHSAHKRAPSYNDAQKEVLEAHWRKETFVTRPTAEELARQIDRLDGGRQANASCVTVWFMNRRKRERGGGSGAKAEGARTDGARSEASLELKVERTAEGEAGGDRRRAGDGLLASGAGREGQGLAGRAGRQKLRARVLKHDEMQPPQESSGQALVHAQPSQTLHEETEEGTESSGGSPDDRMLMQPAGDLSRQMPEDGTEDEDDEAGLQDAEALEGRAEGQCISKNFFLPDD